MNTMKHLDELLAWRDYWYALLTKNNVHPLSAQCKSRIAQYLAHGIFNNEAAYKDWIIGWPCEEYLYPFYTLSPSNPNAWASYWRQWLTQTPQQASLHYPLPKEPADTTE